MRVLKLSYLHEGCVNIKRIDKKPDNWCKNGHRGWFTEYDNHIKECKDKNVYPIGFVNFKAKSMGMNWNSKKQVFEEVFNK